MFWLRNKKLMFVLRALSKGLSAGTVVPWSKRFNICSDVTKYVEVIKLFVLNSTEHEISNAHKN